MLSGIAGFWTREPREVRELSVFTDMLEGRGPHGRGLLIADNNRFGLGSRSLAPISAGSLSSQPFVSPDNRYAIVMDGQIHNSREIRRELESAGHKFRTDTDTEVFLAGYVQWGPDCQNRFNGDWAAVIWDNRDRSLFLVRDRMGHKPLVFIRTSDGIAFASERKAFYALPWVVHTSTKTAMHRS